MLGLLIFVFLGLSSVAIPVIGIPPFVFLLDNLGALPHIYSQRFFDHCTGNWLTLMTVIKWFSFGVGDRVVVFGFKHQL